MAGSTVDYSILYDCESHVDSSFRRLRLSHNQLKKRISVAHDSYLRKIIDISKRQTAEEQSTAYNKRLKRKKVGKRKEGKREMTEEYEEMRVKEEVDEEMEGSEGSEAQSPRGKKETSISSSQVFTSPYLKSPRSSAIPRTKSVPKKRLIRGNTKDILEVDEDISKEYADGRISKAQYHKKLLLRNRMIHFQCLEDLDEEGLVDKDLETIERERQEVERELQKTIARYPKAHASLQPRNKVPISQANTAFRPHREPPAKPSPLPESSSPQPRPLSRTPDLPQYTRQQFFVTTRPSTAFGTLGGGTTLRVANIKHGGRLSAQNMVNYLLNQHANKRKRPLHPPSPSPKVQNAVRKARERLTEERARSLPRLEVNRLQGLYHTAKSRAGFAEVSLDIPSYVNTPALSIQSSERDTKLARSKKASLKDLLGL